MTNQKSFKLEELAKLTDSLVIGDPECVVDNLSTISSASESSITFLTNSKYSGNLKNSKACAVLVDEHYKEDKNFNYLKSYLVYGLFCNNEKCINLFQSITFTSLSWAFSVVSIHDLSGGALMSHIRILLSIEQEAITVASFGDH